MLMIDLKNDLQTIKAMGVDNIIDAPACDPPPEVELAFPQRSGVELLIGMDDAQKPPGLVKEAVNHDGQGWP